MKTSLVTGGAGFIGSHMVDLLISEGYEVIVIDNCSSGRKENLSHISSSKLQFIKEDINNINNLNLPNNIDYIFHFAALGDIVPSINFPSKYFNSNVSGTLEVLEFARQRKIKKLVYSASSSCYGIPKNYPTKEDEKINVEYPYALTKYLAEQTILHWGKVYNLPVVSMRFFNVYGPRSRTSGAYGAVFGVFLKQKIVNVPFTVVGDGNQTRDFTFVTDVVRACFAAAISDIENEIFNVGSGGTYSVNKLIKLLGGEKEYIPKRPGEPDCTFADITKITTRLDWAPKVTFEEGVSIMLENIEYWKDAPLWDPSSIKAATSDWFKYLKEDK